MLEENLTWAEIDLDAIAHNTRELKRLVGDKTELMAVVKANGYGHGAIPVAEAALDNGASRLAVNRAVGGVQLRQAGITAPILVLGYTLPAQAEAIVRWSLTPTVNTPEQVLALSTACFHHGKVLPIHIKIDTGLGRFGLLPDEVADFVQAISTLPGLAIEGVYTHFAHADAADKAYTLQQFEIYLKVVKRLEEAGFAIPIKHVANCAATLDLPETHLDMVRCGIALYGLRPSSEVTPTIALRPAMTLKSRVARVRTLPTGSSIGYGCTYTTSEPTLVALIPVGYGDGYHRLLSNRGQVLIRGQRAAIVGRVCMDQFVVKVPAPTPNPSPESRGGEEAPTPSPSPESRGGEEAPSPLPPRPPNTGGSRIVSPQPFDPSAKLGAGFAQDRLWGGRGAGGSPNVQQDDEVVLLGRQGDDEISAEEVATWAETINYEVTTSILPRVTRVYLKGGQVVAVHPLVKAIQ